MRGMRKSTDARDDELLDKRAQHCVSVMAGWMASTQAVTASQITSWLPVDDRREACARRQLPTVAYSHE